MRVEVTRARSTRRALQAEKRRTEAKAGHRKAATAAGDMRTKGTPGQDPIRSEPCTSVQR